jgi:hypothetical protein
MPTGERVNVRTGSFTPVWRHVHDFRCTLLEQTFGGMLELAEMDQFQTLGLALPAQDGGDIGVSPRKFGDFLTWLRLWSVAIA